MGLLLRAGQAAAGDVRSHNNWIKFIAVLTLLFVVIAFIAPDECRANSPPPPQIVIIVPDAPPDMTITVKPNRKMRRIDYPFISYFVYYGGGKYIDYTFEITSELMEFDLHIGVLSQKYRNTFTLNLDEKTLTPGEPSSQGIREIVLVTLRVLLTLIIEGVVLYLFGYRTKKTWVLFVIVNLLTQTILNFLLNNEMSFLGGFDSGTFFYLVLSEIVITVIELIVFLIFIKEHKRLRTAIYVVAANLLSLIAGGYFISILPV